jgi:hypothetical protein
MKVAMAIPKMPARIPGTTREVHPLAVAMPQAVVGPPTLALDAMSSSLVWRPSRFPTPRVHRDLHRGERKDARAGVDDIADASIGSHNSEEHMHQNDVRGEQCCQSHHDCCYAGKASPRNAKHGRRQLACLAYGECRRHGHGTVHNGW